MEAVIRQPKPEDMQALLEMGRAFHDEAGYSETIPFDIATFARTLGIFANAGLLLVVEKGGRPIGMAAADVAPSVCNAEVRVAREAFWYFRPEHRKGNGTALLKALECTAREYGAHFFDVVAEDGTRSEALARLYRAGGYSPTERTFRKGL